MADSERGPIVKYFANVWHGVVTTFKGMRLTSSYILKPKSTMRYPEERPVITERHRGIHEYQEDNCELCRQCEAVCPVDCITIDAIGRGRDAIITQFDIDYSKCLFCNLCCEACKPECILLGDQYDAATAERDGCILHFARGKSPEEIKEFKAELERKAAEKKAKQEAAKKKKEPENEDKESGESA